MRKKEYQKPEIKIFQIETAGILAVSPGSEDVRGPLYDEIGFSGETCDNPE